MSDRAWLAKDEGEWVLFLQLGVAENEGLADEFADPEEVIKLAEELKTLAVELRKKRTEDPAKCKGCGLKPSDGWYGHKWCGSCMDALKHEFDRISKEQGSRVNYEQAMIIVNSFKRK